MQVSSAGCQVPGSQAPSQALMHNISLLAGSRLTLASHSGKVCKGQVLYTSVHLYVVSNVTSLQLDYSKWPLVEVTGVFRSAFHDSGSAFKGILYLGQEKQP